MVTGSITPHIKPEQGPSFFNSMKTKIVGEASEEILKLAEVAL